MPKITVANDPITHFGQTDTLRNWCARLGLNYTAVAQRYRRMPKPVDSVQLFSNIRTYKEPRDMRNDLVPESARSRQLRALAYPPAIHMLTEPQAEILLTANGYDPVMVRDVLQDMLRQAVATRYNFTDRHDPLVPDDPMAVIYARLPKAQRDKLRANYDGDLLYIFAELEAIVGSLLPLAVQRRFGVSPEGTQVSPDKT